MREDAGDRGTRARPTSEEAFAAAVDIATRGSTRFKRFARRYSLCAADAEDAYQRSLEILLRKAPTTDRAELRAWLHTVIKHEALALRRQRERAVSGAAGPPENQAETAPSLDEQASDRERARQTAEALAHLKPSEMRCLLLKALGYSYDEIAERTGFSWTKVNRSLTEGRRRFLERFGELGSGERCAEFQALLSVACDGEASEDVSRSLRAHLDRCGGCRAALRSYRTAPQRLAELLPPGAIVGLSQQQGWWARLGDALQIGVGDRAGALAWKLQQGAEAISAQKAAAVVASSAALAGGTAVHERADHQPPRAHSSSQFEKGGGARSAAIAPVPAPTAVAAPPAGSGSSPDLQSAAAPAEGTQPAEEFSPAPATDPAPTPAPSGGEANASTEFAGQASAGGPASGGSEFGP